ncbi:hypothetical protein GGF43_003968 [Coemansia sp. RSA 2618]|nr:hypothetical protein GGF43_003968 [Coemansia sp. RSA 2618]
MRVTNRQFDSSAESDSNPWALVDTVEQPQQHTRQRIAHRERAVHDPLLYPSAADVGMFNRAVARRAEHGLLESIDDAVSSPLPRSETFMVGVKADSDVVSQDIPDAVDGKSAASDEHNAASRTLAETSPLFGLAIAQNYEHGSYASLNPQPIPEILLPAFKDKDVASSARLGGGIYMSEASSSVPYFDAAQQQQLPPISQSLPSALSMSPQISMRTIKMIRHCIRAADTLQGISVQYGIRISDLKRLNRLWQPNEMATRKYLYVPLRMCLPKFTIANIEHANMRHKEELRSGQMPTAQPIDLIEVVLDPETSPAPAPRAFDTDKPAPGPPWPRVSYESIQRIFSFTL